MVTPLRLFVLGATGRIGRELLAQAQQRGHHVTAFVRSPEKLGVLTAGDRAVRGDPRSVTELTIALPQHDAVISALGAPGPGPTTLQRDCIASTVAAMQAVGPRRLLVVSAAMLFPDAGLLAAVLRTTLLRNVAEDSSAMEKVVMASGLEWSIARPPRLTDGPLTGRYQIEDGRFPSGKGSLARANVAHFLLSEVEQGAHLRQVVGLAG